MEIRPFDREALKRAFSSAKPFPFVKIDDFLDLTFAKEVAAAYPSFETALSQGRTFKAVNEKKKVQITNANLFPSPVAKLNGALASPAFLDDLSYITGIPNLLADPELVGGGMHMTGPGGRLDVHVDFNFIEARKLHRRLNLLLYLNPKWDESWGGHIQLWDKDVSKCEQAFVPKQNRCVIFETSEISYHGVVPVTVNAPPPRISFATYYYTREAPANWTGNVHSTIFKARPEERLQRYVSMPAELMQRRLSEGVHRLKSGVKKLIGSSR
jgi:Rps23 Pro-64 3,4-dihydroxylase Tpa1-like proline 4-hydroxylase